MLEGQNIQVKVGPNPFVDQLLIQLPEYQGNWTATLLDAQGRWIAQKAGQNNQLLWNGLDGLPAGVYLVQVETEKGASTIKLIK